MGRPLNRAPSGPASLPPSPPSPLPRLDSTGPSRRPLVGGRAALRTPPGWTLPVGSQAQLIAQAIGQAFAAAYSQFLRESGIDPSQVGAPQSQGAAGPGHLHNGDLDHFSNSENCREVSKRPGGPAGPPTRGPHARPPPRVALPGVHREAPG